MRVCPECHGRKVDSVTRFICKDPCPCCAGVGYIYFGKMYPSKEWVKQAQQDWYWIEGGGQWRLDNPYHVLTPERLKEIEQHEQEASKRPGQHYDLKAKAKEIRNKKNKGKPSSYWISGPGQWRFDNPYFTDNPERRERISKEKESVRTVIRYTGKVPAWILMPYRVNLDQVVEESKQTVKGEE